MQTTNRLKEYRDKRGISAVDLARQASVTRQTIYAIEAGSFVPNTAVALQLARALETSVEELFQIEGLEIAEAAPAVVEYLSAAREPFEGEPVRICEVGRRTLAVPADIQQIYLPPADAIIVGATQEVQARIFADTREARKRLLVAGCDPGISILAQHLADSSEIDLVPAPCSSRQALEWLKEGKIHVAGSHLRDARTGEFNLPFVKEVFPRGGYQIVTFAVWEEGFVVRRGNPRGIRSAADLAGATIVNREKGAGSRELLDRLLKAAGVSVSKVRGYATIASGHLPAAWKVASGEADCCIATRLAARALGLDFIPLAVERYDLITLRRIANSPEVQTVFDALNRANLRRKLELLAGYDTTRTGQTVE